mgnify:CR=1 FL=1
MIKSVTDPVTVANDLRPVLLKLSRHLRRELHHLDVSAGQLSILAEIAKTPGIGIRGLSDSEGVSAAQAGRRARLMVGPFGGIATSRRIFLAARRVRNAAARSACSACPATT